MTSANRIYTGPFSKNYGSVSATYNNGAEGKPLIDDAETANGRNGVRSNKEAKQVKKVQQKWKNELCLWWTLFKLSIIVKHVTIYAVICAIIWGALYFVEQNDIILNNLSFLDDWKQLGLIFGLFSGFAVKKVWDVGGCIPNTDRAIILAYRAIKNEEIFQELCSYIFASVGFAFSELSKHVENYLMETDEKMVEIEINKIDETDNGNGIASNLRRAKLRIREERVSQEGVTSPHSIIILWGLTLLDEEDENGKISDIRKELMDILTQCDKLINLRHAKFATLLTNAVMISIYSHFVVSTVRQLLNASNAAWWFIAFVLNAIYFFIFIIFWRYAEQTMKPFDVVHDVYELKRILLDKEAIVRALAKQTNEQNIERVPVITSV